MLSFNLVDENWIPCVMTDGTLATKSLRSVLLDPVAVREIAGDSPPVTIALYRLLLAILHRALNAPRSADDWSGYWKARTWNGDKKLEEYLNRWKHRFDLFDERRPFYQVSTIKDSVQAGAIIQLYFQDKNNATLFDHSTTGLPNSVTAAQAARLLIAFQGFDFGGIKANGSAQTAPLLQCAVGLLRGDSIFETLMLNLHRYNGEDGEPFDFDPANDLPPWERDTETESAERGLAGYVDLLTRQSRSILLEPETDSTDEIIVRNTVIMLGFKFPNEFQLNNKETMIAFRKSNTAGFYAVGFNENKALWRDSPLLLQSVEGQQSRMKMLSWINELAFDGILERSSEYPIDFYGMSADKAKLLFWRQDRFVLPLAYLNDDNLLHNLKLAIQFSEDIGGVLRAALKALADSLETQLGSFPAMGAYWGTLEGHFKQLLVDLPQGGDSAMRRWFVSVDGTAKAALNQTSNSLSGSAAELKAIVGAESYFYRLRNKTLTDEYRQFLREFKTKGGDEI